MRRNEKLPFYSCHLGVTQVNLHTWMSTGAKASHNHTVHTLYNATIRSVTDRKLVEFVEVVDVANVVEGAPSKLAESLIYFSQGCGVLGAVPMPHLGSQTRSDTTMEALDKSDM